MSADNPASTWAQPNVGPQQQIWLAHEEFQKRLHDVWPVAEAEQAVTNAYAAYAALLLEPWQSFELNKRLAEAYELYRKKVHEAFAGGKGGAVLNAYRDYVRHLKKVWAELDPESMSPEDLGAIAQGMSWVAGVAFEVSVANSSTTEPRS